MTQPDDVTTLGHMIQDACRYGIQLREITTWVQCLILRRVATNLGGVNSLPLDEIARPGSSVRTAAVVAAGYERPSVVAKRLGTSADAVKKWATAGVLMPDGLRVRLRADRIGSRLMIPVGAVDEFFAATNGSSPTGPDTAPPTVTSAAA